MSLTIVYYSLDNFDRFHALFSSISDFSEGASRKPNSQKNKDPWDWRQPQRGEMFIEMPYPTPSKPQRGEMFIP